MKKKLLLFTIVLLPILGFSQYNIDVGVNLGASNYLGEIGGSDQPARPWIMDLRMKSTRYTAGAFLRYRIGRNIGLNGQFNWVRITAADSLTVYPERFGRNLSFRNDILEASLRLEYYLFSINDIGRSLRTRIDYKFFGFGGIAGFYNNPKAHYDGDWIALQPLRTEGADNTYSKFQFSVPVGLGMFFTFDRQHRIGWELNWRLTFTDYVDDISTTYPDFENLPNNELSQELTSRSDEVDPNHPNFLGEEYYGPGAIRGNPENNDSYLTTVVTYSYVLRGKSNFSKARYNYIYGKRRKYRKS